MQVTVPFVVLNGDTLYGKEALSMVCDHIRDNYDRFWAVTMYYNVDFVSVIPPAALRIS